MTPSERIDALIAGIADWRGKTFASVRKAILAADPEIVEEWKYMGSPVWSRGGMIAVANAHKGKVNSPSPMAPTSPIPTGFSTRGWKATCAAPSIMARATRPTPRR